ncbi:POT family-domain-containing protein [Naematelia encephala]|uniref:POT family-domain-containing protein n=1 Tax=Naematelia encephala TaxID=71784 RepID=A0A1Y2ASN5_9TREE|nr:POT family-domain-containing protein [Naematelia encephala]
MQKCCLVAPFNYVNRFEAAITTARLTGPFNNFINNPFPVGGNGAGAVAPGDLGLQEHAGALGLGSVDTSAFTNMFTFLAFVIPIFGGILADTKLGRFKTICWGTAVGAIAHVLLVIPAIPSVIANPNGSLGAFVISIVILAFAAGLIKPSLGPLLCDQSPVKLPFIKTLASGERVIVDPETTVQRYLLIFYGVTNAGAFFAVATEYAEHDIGFWLAYLLPGILYMLMPIVLIIAYKHLYLAPPQSSVVVEAMRVMGCLFSNGEWKQMWRADDSFWNAAKPSYLAEHNGGLDRTKIFWDDTFVDEIRQSLNACAVFALVPIFVLADGGIGNQMNDMSHAMLVNGVPNDLLSSLNPLAIIVFTPIITYGLYPLMSKLGYPLKPMTRMCIGFLLGALGAMLGAIIQWRVYSTSPCGDYATTCVDDDGGPAPSTISLWLQIPIIFFPAVGELFVVVTSYESAYTRSPARMKGLVYALALFNFAIAAAISLALSQAIQDLVWPWVALTVACVICAIALPTYFSHLNTPMLRFADRDRQAGKYQPNVINDADTNA